MQLLNILVIQKHPIFYINDKKLDEIRNINTDITVEACSWSELTMDMIKKAEVIFGWPSKELIIQAEKLRWLHLPSAGVDKYADKSIYRQDDIILTNSSGVYGTPISEHVIGLILAFNRNLHLHIRSQIRGNWNKRVQAREFYGSTVGIVGLGDIGRKVAISSKALGARVIAVKRNPDKALECVDELYNEEGIDKLVEQSDYLVLCLPDTPKTRGIISKERIDKMKKDAFIVNIGRGSAIDQDALVNALEESRIAGAGLDVTTPEPLPEDSPLWNMSNVIITSHTSGFSPRNPDRIFKVFIENLNSYIEKDPLKNKVDFKEGY